MLRALKTLVVAFACSAGLRAADFDTVVVPVLSNSCRACHSNRGAAGGLDIAQFLVPSSILSLREEWEVILKKLRSGQMPPRNSPRPPQEKIDAVIDYVEGELDRADRGKK
jgi:mono/diheme cytochrome c family protein